MLNSKQKKEILEHLEKAQNPIFYFDNDPDGLCSFLLLQRFIGRGKGVAIKGEMMGNYFRKVQELNSDYVFILDKPLVTKEFFEEVEKVNVPVVWIDHHEIDRSIVPDFVNYYNPFFNKPSSNEPVTAFCYDLTKKKEDMWLAVAGCVSDAFVPDFYSEFMKKYPDLGLISEKAFDILYGSQIGKIAMIFSHALKDKTTNVVNMLRFLMKVKTPYEVLEETNKNKTMHERYNQINKKIKELADRAEVQQEKILFFKYGGELSFSSELSNELWYRFPKKIIVVAYVKGNKVNISLRGKNIKKDFLKVIGDIEGAKGGGHDNAVGAQIKFDDLEKFKRNLSDLVEPK